MRCAFDLQTASVSFSWTIPRASSPVTYTASYDSLNTKWMVSITKYGCAFCTEELKLPGFVSPPRLVQGCRLEFMQSARAGGPGGCHFRGRKHNAAPRSQGSPDALQAVRPAVILRTFRPSPSRLSRTYPSFRRFRQTAELETNDTGA